MNGVLKSEALSETLARLDAANRRIAAAYPGDRLSRQPVHTVYGGAQLFAADIARKLGEGALESLREFAPEAESFGRAVGLEGDEAFRRTVYERVVEKLRREPVEDLRIDFEDGYGNRPDEIEDGHAVKVAEEVARGDRERLLPPGIGIRVKPLTAELHARSLRTLDLFVTTLACANAGALPANFCVTLPKITDAQQVATFVDVLELIERGNALTPGSIPIELMVETTQSIFGPDGSMPLLSFVAAGRGRVRGAHFGVYDYTASCNVTASHQAPGHHACEFARLAMQAALAGTGVTLSDGSSAVLPVPPHRVAAGRALTPEQRRENEAVVHGAWRVHFDDVRASLRDAYYQGWDLHPAHLPTRYAAVFSFFLEGREAAAQRLRAFVDKAAQATRLGSVFDDAATGQGLLNFFLRGLSCGALTEAEALESGLTLEELRGRSFSKILAGRG